MTRSDFLREIAKLPLSHCERAIALLWYYQHTQEYDERSASDLAADLHDEGFPKPNISRLAGDLRRSRIAIRGRRPGTFQIDLRQIPTLDEQYGPSVGVKKITIESNLIPAESIENTRNYIEKLTTQVNGAYQFGFYDACAVLCRRLMESLIIEIYVSRSRHNEIQQSGAILPLEKLMSYLIADRTIPLSRSAPKTMDLVKDIGDAAAHDRTYITKKEDIEEIKLRFRKFLSELLALSGVKK